MCECRQDSVRITDSTIERRFGYHRPRGSQSELYDQIRGQFIGAAKQARDLIPPGPDADGAVEKILEAMRAVIAGVACNDVGVGVVE